MRRHRGHFAREPWCHRAELTVLLQLEGDGRLNQRLYRALRRAILDGRLAPGSRLPSTRELAQNLGISRNVVMMAFAQLTEEGYVEARRGSGTIVSPMLPDPAPSNGSARGRTPDAHPRLSSYARRVLALAPLPAVGRPPREGLQYDFRYGLPAIAEFPQKTWSRLAARRAKSMSISALRYGRALGFLPLRRAIAEYVTRTRGIAASPEQVVIVNGSQQALDLIARLAIDRDDRVVVEEPSYLSARQVFAAAGATLIPVPVDEHGIQTSRLPRDERVRLAYVTPSHQFPLGGVLPHARRLELLRWANEMDALIVEDDYDSEFWYDGHPVAAIQGLDRAGRVVYIGTFSKVLFPSLRVGYMIVPASLVPALAALKFLSDRHTPIYEQEVLTEFIEDGHFEHHVRRARTRNAARRAAMVDAFRATFGERARIAGASAGVHMVVWLRGLSAAREHTLIERAADRDVGIYSVLPYYVAPPDEIGLLLGYAAMTEREIREGVRLLGDVVAKM